jgi:DNA polymerase V
MAALDTVNDRWGTGTLEYAASGITKAWKTQFHRRSLAYTTDWDALPVVRA